MTKVSFVVRSNIELVRKNNENLRKDTHRIAKTRLKAAAQEVKTRMSKPGRHIGYPIPWKSFKQKIKVIFLVMKLQGTLPYKRTREAQRGWSVVEVPDKGYAVEHSMGKRTKYIYGDTRGNHQQPFLVNFPNLREQTQFVLNKLPKAMIEALKTVLKKV